MQNIPTAENYIHKSGELLPSIKQINTPYVWLVVRKQILDHPNMQDYRFFEFLKALEKISLAEFYLNMGFDFPNPKILGKVP